MRASIATDDSQTGLSRRQCTHTVPADGRGLECSKLGKGSGVGLCNGDVLRDVLVASASIVDDVVRLLAAEEDYATLVGLASIEDLNVSLSK